MNDADVSKQIQQMVRFIRQEAEEKANEIAVSAEEVQLTSLASFLFAFSIQFSIFLFSHLKRRSLIYLYSSHCKSSAACSD